MCFVRYQEEGASLPNWYLVQVDLEKTDPVEAHQQGKYICKWWIKHHTDSLKRKTRDCRFWPDVRQFNEKGVLTQLLLISLDKCERFLERWNKKYGWFQDEVCLAEHLLVGPFDLINKPGPRSLRKMEKNRIDDEIWERLKFVGQARRLDMKGIEAQITVHPGRTSASDRQGLERGDKKPKSK